MVREERIRLAQGYAFHLGPPCYKGCGHLVRIIRRFVESGLSADEVNYKQLIATVAKERNIQPRSLKQSVQWYINAGWKHGAADTWKRLANWDHEYAPDADTAIRLICGTVDNYLEEISHKLGLEENQWNK